MNGAELHLVLVHFPLVMALLSTLALIVAIATRRPERLKFAFELMVLGAIASFAAHWTGDGAHEFLEHYLGPAHDKIMPLISDHEEWADKANIAMIVGGLVGLVGWAFSRHPDKFRMGAAIIALAVMGTSTALIGVTTKKGGLIRHPEVQAVNDAPSSASPDANESGRIETVKTSGEKADAATNTTQGHDKDDDDHDPDSGH